MSETPLVPSQVATATKRNQTGRRRKGNKNNQRDDANNKQNDTQRKKNQQNSDNNNQNKRKKKKNAAKQVKEINKEKQQQDHSENKKKPVGKKSKRNRRGRGQDKKFPWRRVLPEGSVDPITLEPLSSLKYPPFALCADSPYTVVPEWPIVEEEDNSKEEEERQKKVLESQWGSHALKRDNSIAEQIPLSKRKFNLYDGRALAYYMVSQLQFIDPLNRRDLTRDELISLDTYLKRHGFHSLVVTDAYDDRGVTLSRAGAAASTPTGQLELRQQSAQALAQSLLQNLFAGGGNVVVSNSSTNDNTSNNSLQEQYAASQRREQEDARRRRNQQNASNIADSNDTGIYGGDGFMVIDDDANPGLRGTNRTRDYDNHLTAAAPSFTPGTLWSASHITNHYHSFVSHDASQHASNFPALQESINENLNYAATSREPNQKQQHQKKKPPSKSLSRITKVVSKTDPKEIQKQREARELFVKRAAMANLSFGSDPATALAAPSGLLTVPASTNNSTASGPTEGQLARNQALASALGVVPTTAREQQNNNFNQGWARPVDFNDELNTAVYPPTLITAARERGLEFLLKLEKKWKAWLQDDTAASLPLSKMDRSTRILVHEYSDFWKLHTESFDPEPRRYIHCVKLRDTAAPNPLLSVVVRNWRGPIHEQQTAGQSPREFPPPPEREKLQLKPRSMTPTEASARLASAATPFEKNVRSDELFVGRERPRLELAPRTLPTELPPMEKVYSLAEEREMQLKLRKEEENRQAEKERLKRRALESAFASDDEEGSIKSHDSAEWEEFDDTMLEPAYVASDGED